MKYLLLPFPLKKSSLLLRLYYKIENTANKYFNGTVRWQQKSYWLATPTYANRVSFQKKKQKTLRPFSLRSPFSLIFNILLYSLYRNFILQYNLWVYLQQLTKLHTPLNRPTLVRQSNLPYLKTFKRQLSLL